MQKSLKNGESRQFLLTTHFYSQHGVDVSKVTAGSEAINKDHIILVLPHKNSKMYLGNYNCIRSIQIRIPVQQKPTMAPK